MGHKLSIGTTSSYPGLMMKLWHINMSYTEVAVICEACIIYTVHYWHVISKRKYKYTACVFQKSARKFVLLSGDKKQSMACSS